MSENNNGERIAALEATMKSVDTNVQKILNQNDRFLEKMSRHDEKLKTHDDEIKGVQSKGWKAIATGAAAILAVIIGKIFP